MLPVLDWRRPCLQALRTRIGVVAIALALLATTAMPAQAQAGALEHELNLNAKKAVEFLRQRGYKNVGVLKFRVIKGNEAPSDNVGPLNMSLARRLEMALVLADVRGELGHLRNASAVAARIPGANHLTREGRARLFEGDYPLVIGKGKVKADAFLGGLVLITPDLRQMAVDIRAFGKQDNGSGSYSIAKFAIAIDDPNILIESGESFRGAFGGKRLPEEPQAPVQAPVPLAPVAPTPPETPVVKNAYVVKNNPEQYYPLLPANSPAVTLKIYYGNRLIVPDIRNGKAQIPEPETGERVTFNIKNNHHERVGVVLKVNGLNTLFKQNLRDIDCRKWILDPQEAQTIYGFHYPDGRAVSFTVKSPEESAADEVNYGEDVGTISISVFRDAKDYVPPLPALAQRNELALAPGAFPTPPQPDEGFESLDQLRTLLRRGGEQTRGLIAEGREEYKVNLQQVVFKPHPEPLMSATISYYTRKTAAFPPR